MVEGNVYVPQQPQPSIVTAAEFNAKFRSKREVYQFLAFDVGAYLPPYDNVTVFHLRDLASGKRQIIKADRVKTIHVPHFEGLTLDTMLYHARKSAQVVKALPLEPREVDKLPRSYIANVIYTIVGERFKQWVESQIQQRTQKVIDDQDMAIEMDPEVLAAFKASNHVSGKYIHLFFNHHSL